MHGRKSGERLVYECGRYVDSGAAECHHNTVDADAMLKLVLDSLVACVTKAGGREAIRERLLAKARAEAAGEAPDEEHAALPHLRRRVAELEDDLATAGQRMAREKDNARYEALAKAFDEIQAEREGAARRIEELSRRPTASHAASSPEETVEALMLAIDELAAVTTDETARQRIRPLVLRLGIWIGLDFEGYTKGKRPLRRLRRGVIVFGQENLPIRVHGARHVAVEETVPAAPPPPRLATQPVRRLDLVAAGPATAAHDDHGVSPDTPHHNQGAPARCRGPSVESGAQGGDGTGDGRTNEPRSGMVQFRTVSESGRLPAPEG